MGEIKGNKKKILVVSQLYKPEPFRVSDICEKLVERGYEVHVITDYPNIPDGKYYKGYGIGKRIDEVMDGVTVHRCFTIPRKKGIVFRILNYYSFAISASRYARSKKCVASDGKKFDLVFCYQLSPVTMMYAAVAYKRKHNVPLITYCLDLWPESLTVGGIKRDSVLYNYYLKVCKGFYRQSDKILITSRMFSDYFNKKFKIKNNRLSYLPQAAEGVFSQLPIKEENGIFDFVFAGNIGVFQSIETILKAAEALEEEPVRFHIVGSGSNLDKLKRDYAHLNNVIFYGRRPIEEMPSFYAMADAMLVTLTADPVISLTLPGKVQSYMAVGKPIIGAIDGETKVVIEEAKCGFCGKAEQVDELVGNIRRFMSPHTDRVEMSRRSREYYEKYFMQDIFMAKLVEEINYKI